MKHLIPFVCIIFWHGATFAADTYVDGYYRKDGTYVQPHTRSSPNSQRYDNYGQPSSGQRRSGGYQSPYGRDYDSDGISNEYDYDDNNDGVSDDGY